MIRRKYLLLVPIICLCKFSYLEASDKDWKDYPGYNQSRLHQNHNDKIEDEWEIVPSSATTAGYESEEENELLLNLKAFGNTALSVVGGIALNVFERTLQQQANEFTAGMRRGTNLIGNSYGQGLAFRNAFEYEKQSLREKH